MQALSKAFVERACRYLNSQLSHLGDQVLTNMSNMKGSSRRSMPDHRNIRQQAGLLQPLMQVCTSEADHHNNQNSADRQQHSLHDTDPSFS